MPLLSIELLGRPRISLDGRPLTIRVRKELALLAFLAIEQEHRHSRDRVLGLLWPDAAEEAARNNLRVLLANLRRLLAAAGDDFLRADRQYVQFAPESDHAVDALSFRRAMVKVRTHAHIAAEQCDACIAQLAEAAELYRGDLLADFSLPDSAPFDEWAMLVREQLHQQALEALGVLATAAELHGDHATQCRYARRQIELDPWRESSHAQLMRGLVLAGDRSAALAQFETCQRILADELGIEPSSELATLAEQLRATAARPRPAPAVLSIQPALPEVARLYGRADELAQLQRWLADGGCRLVGLLGIGGVGKTTLAAAAAREIAQHFDAVAWCSLLNAPPLDVLLHDALGQLMPGAADQPDAPDAQIAQLLEVLKRTRCLVVLDNLESILQADQPGVMRAGYEGYAQLLLAIAQRAHRSCILFTSRERPHGLARLEEDTQLVRLLRLDGLDVGAAEQMLAARGLQTNDGMAGALVRHYSGNPLALRLVAQTVREVFDGDIRAFLEAETPIFDDIGAVLDQQMARLSPLERDLLVWLAIEREPTSMLALRANLVRPEPPRAVVEAVRALLRRSLVAQNGGSLVLQNIVTEYLTERLIARLIMELEHQQLDWLHRYALLKTNAPEYVRQSQVRLIVEPIARRLAATHSMSGVEALVRRVLVLLRDAGQRQPSYAAGNLLNLLNLLQIDIQGYDFSGLCVWQADLREVAAFDVNFAGADLAHAAFSDLFDAVNSVAFSPDGALVAAGSGNGLVGAWRVADGQRHALFNGHRVPVWSVAFSPDGRVLASASFDTTVRLWDVASGESIMVLSGHSKQVIAVAFVRGTSFLITGSADGTIRLWDTRDGCCVNVFDGHPGGVYTLAVDPTGALVAASDAAGYVSLWRIAEGERVFTLAHPQAVQCAAFSADGRLLVTGCNDTIARMWDTGTGQLIRQLQGHSNRIYSARWSPNDSTIATGGMDTTIRLWNAQNGEPLRVLRGHAGNVNGLDWNPDGSMLVSAGHDETVRVWSAQSGNTLRVLQGNAAGVLSLTFGSDSTTLYSTQGDVVRIWDVQQRRRRRVLRGHRDVTTSVSASRDGMYLASASRDSSVRVWDVARGRPLPVLNGHTGLVLVAAFSPDGMLLASAGSDTRVRLWDVRKSKLVRSFTGHTGWIEAVCFSGDGGLLVSGSYDGTVRIWDVAQGQLLQCISAPHLSAVRSVALSPDGALLAYAGNNGVTLMELSNGKHIHTLLIEGITTSLAFNPDGTRLAIGGSDRVIRVCERDSWTARQIGRHEAWIGAVSWSPDGSLLASSSLVGEIVLWDGYTGARVGELRDDGPYSGMNITHASGITEAQRAGLVALGAIDGVVLPGV